MNPDWPRICITVLTVAAFGLSAAGLVHVWFASRRSQAQMRAEVEAKQEIWDEMAEVLSVETDSELRQAAFALREERYQQAGLELQTIELAEQGREPLAEKLVEEFHGGSRVDVVLVGLGLLCGLAASIWGTWLPSA